MIKILNLRCKQSAFRRSLHLSWHLTPHSENIWEHGCVIKWVTTKAVSKYWLAESSNLNINCNNCYWMTNIHTGDPSSLYERGRDSCLRAVLCYKRLFTKACMGCKRFFLKDRKKCYRSDFNLIALLYSLLFACVSGRFFEAFSAS